MLNSKGQNLIEYILLVAAVLAVGIYFYANQTNGPMAQSVNACLYSIVNEINVANNQINIAN